MPSHAGPNHGTAEVQICKFTNQTAIAIMLVGFDRYLMTMNGICKGILRSRLEGLAFFRGIHAGHSKPEGFMLAVQNI